MSDLRNPKIDVVNETGASVSIARLRNAVKNALTQQSRVASDICVLLTSDQAIQELNARFRGIDEPTDVLTFPHDDGPPNKVVGGDIAVSVPRAERQAQARGVTLINELSFLVIHGTLHLAGLDDQTDRDREQMIETMNLVAEKCGLEPDTEWHSLHDEAAS